MSEKIRAVHLEGQELSLPDKNLARLEKLDQWRQEAIAKWLDTHATQEKVETRVTDVLDRRLSEIVAKLLGFNKDSWSDRWEVDHCNGRGGDTAISDRLKTQSKDVVNAWLDTCMGKMPKPTAQFKKAIRKEFQGMVEKAVREKVREIAYAEAQKQAEQIVGTALVDKFGRS